MTTTYVSFTIVNNSQKNGGGLTSEQIYLFVTQEKINTAWRIDKSTGIATPLPPGVLPPPVTLADLSTIKIDSSLSILSARIYLGSSPNTVTAPGNNISGPTAGTAQFYYDFFEFALTPGSPNNLNVDTTQVDQLGLPMKLQVLPADPDFPDGSGIVATLDRQTLFGNFQTMAGGNLRPFADCVFGAGTPPYRLLNPSDVVDAQLNAMLLQGTIAPGGGSSGNWLATFTITGPGQPPPTNGGLHAGMLVSGPRIPAGATVQSIPGFPTGYAVTMASTSPAATNPFVPSQGAVSVYFLKPVATRLGTYFDHAIYFFFNYYKQPQNLLKVEQHNGSGDYVYTGNVVEIHGVPAIDGNSYTYTVLQFTGGANETYNIFYPFFTTNALVGATTPFDKPVPPPPVWWLQGMKIFEPPSAMVFGADGVFADSAQQKGHYPGLNAAVLGGIENVVVTALARGCATTLKYKYGSLDPILNHRKANVTLQSGEDTAGLVSGSYMFSFQIAQVPMVANIPGGAPITSFYVTSPRKIEPTVTDLLTFSEFYPAGGTWSAFANYLHNGAGTIVTIDGRAYALPYDDQGGFSTDLNSGWFSGQTPAAVTVTLGPWKP
ncbi:MAG: hypothetical protein HYZ40_05285 [Rhodospirillales bacterium]|nr:hypothetical protein [Rhodospirillales bacterium]